MLRFNEITDVNYKDFIEAMRIYTESFPLNERQPENIIKERVEKKLYQMYIGQLNNSVALMALFYPLKKTNFILFDYMATAKKFRNKGIGTKFIQHMINILENNISSTHMILEVENPRYGTNKEQKKRRVAFYKRLGAKEMNNVRYVLPPLSGSDLPTEMILMVLPDYNNGIIDGNLVRELIIQIYKEVYNRDKSDFLLNSFIGEIKNNVELI